MRSEDALYADTTDFLPDTLLFTNVTTINEYDVLFCK